MKKTAYFDCYSGASGDMLLATLLDKLIDFEWFLNELKKINLPENSYKISKEIVFRSSIASSKLNIETHEHHHHRSYSTICNIINDSNIDENAKKLSLQIFSKIATAEATIHQVDIEKIHFHEVGALDSIIDIVGFCICYSSLNIEKCIVSALPIGSGTVHCQHGAMPVPAPATLEILKDSILNINSKISIEEECLTPTATAILSTIADECGANNIEKVEAISYGAGNKIFPNNIISNLRLITGFSS